MGAIDLVVGAHHRARAAFFHADLKTLEIKLTRRALVQHAVAHIAEILTVIDRKVLRACRRSRALHTIGKGSGHLAGQQRIFAVIFEVSAAARVALQIQRRPEQHLHIIGTALFADGLTHAPRDFLVPAVGNIDTGGKRGGRTAFAQTKTSLALSISFFAKTQRSIGQKNSRNIKPRHSVGHPRLKAFQKGGFFRDRQLFQQFFYRFHFTTFLLLQGLCKTLHAITEKANVLSTGHNIFRCVDIRRIKYPAP